jgi:Fe-S-cluster containining protein
LPVVGGSGDLRATAITGRAADAVPDLEANLNARVGNESRLVLRRDSGVAERPAVQVDCAARMRICQAVCCKLEFALTREEVLAGEVQWDLSRPFFVGRATNGYCVHNDRRTGGCGVYADRPAICRRWSCANDPRIWKDFEQMMLNVEWLSTHGFICEGWAFTTPSPDGARTPPHESKEVLQP